MTMSVLSDPQTIQAAPISGDEGDACVGLVVAVAVRVDGSQEHLPADAMLHVQAFPLDAQFAEDAANIDTKWLASGVLAGDGSWVTAQPLLIPLVEEGAGLPEGSWSAGANIEATLTGEAGVPLVSVEKSCRTWVSWGD